MRCSVGRRKDKLRNRYIEEVFDTKQERDARYIELTTEVLKYGTYHSKKQHIFRDTTSILKDGKGKMVYRLRRPID